MGDLFVAIPIPQTPPLPLAGSYQVRNLHQLDFDDYHPLLLHMTARGSSKTECDDPAIAAASALERLAGILGDCRLRAFPMFGTGVRAACFTENSRLALNWLIAEKRHKPWGVAFSKDLVFQQGGGPVIEIRGDEWPLTECWPPELVARLKRLWPGAESAGGAVLPWYLAKVSEWSFEREWRLPLEDLLFEPSDIAFVICESEDGLAELVRLVGARSPAVAQHLAGLQNLVWDEARKMLV
jgi:hypothetical protein